MKIHVVQKGDTLWTIAKNYQVSFEELKAANAYLADPDMIMPGMKIKIPAGKAAVDKAGVKKAAMKKAEYMHPYADGKPAYQALPEEKVDMPVMPYAGFMMPVMPKMQEMPKMKEMPKMQEMPKAEEIKEWTKMPEKPSCTCKEKSAVKPVKMMPQQMPHMMPQQMPQMMPPCQMPQQMPHMMPPCQMQEHPMMMEPWCHPMPHHCCCPCHHPYRGPF
ncbi:SafA/ExsA family spore coat assembly protein [Jeotgalibacillus haloalkalitolerans]|uniref:SafA/ExsA family spore coat assembly protein n=1 Tax=Jeotgalibacillus haloalkalitolerans TaxID=3104292 RepID=A0ABU5KM48_9BACL|nr:SafA/ExsA family spore coat assembly protein [Jeotgalibacillus sp. HH7-29]MDZ5712342.1 SafA/ExsA family spore coat assembly protein [Jeotgalibacillus sp. HH7-29]